MSLRDKIISVRDRERISIVDNGYDITATIDGNMIIQIVYDYERIGMYQPNIKADAKFMLLRKLAIEQAMDMAEEHQKLEVKDDRRQR